MFDAATCDCPECWGRPVVVPGCACPACAPRPVDSLETVTVDATVVLDRSRRPRRARRWVALVGTAVVAFVAVGGRARLLAPPDPPEPAVASPVRPAPRDVDEAEALLSPRRDALLSGTTAPPPPPRRKTASASGHATPAPSETPHKSEDEIVAAAAMLVKAKDERSIP